jgi:pre-mRNA-splicing factor SPF27
MTCICGVSSWSDGGLLVLLQQAAAVELNLLSSQWKEISQKNLDIEDACLKLEAEVFKLHEEAEKK